MKPSKNGFLMEEALLGFLIMILAVTLLCSCIYAMKKTGGLLIEETIGY